MRLSTVQPNVLPNAWIDRLFGRLAAMYGKHWLDLWADVPMADVKDAWQTELAGVTGDQLVAALKGLGKFPPTLPEFVALCKPPATPAAHRLLLRSSAGPRPPIDPAVKAKIDQVLDGWRH